MILPLTQPNFAALIKDVKAALNKINRSDVKISVAAAGDIEKLKKANIPALIDAGVWGINLMTLRLLTWYAVGYRAGASYQSLPEWQRE